MSVESVNSNSNRRACVISAAVGAGAGATAAYLTKPYLKDGVPTDKFTKKIYENALEKYPEKAREIENNFKLIEDAKSVEEIKNVLTNFKNNKLPNSATLRNLKSMGFDITKEEINKSKEIKTIEDAKKFAGEIFDKKFAGKSIDEIKNTIKEEKLKAEKQTGKVLFEQFWDSEKKEFKNCEKGFGKDVKKAAKSIQGKFALIYGCIGALFLGIVARIAIKGKKSEQVPEDKMSNS